MTEEIHSITVKVNGDKAIVRMVLRDANGKHSKRGLSLSGKWVEIEEGEAYPQECILSVETYKDGYKIWGIGEYEAKYNEAEEQELENESLDHMRRGWTMLYNEKWRDEHERG